MLVQHQNDGVGSMENIPLQLNKDKTSCSASTFVDGFHHRKLFRNEAKNLVQSANQSIENLNGNLQAENLNNFKMSESQL